MIRPGIFVALLTLAPLVSAAAEPEGIPVCAHANAGFYTRDTTGGATGLEADLLNGFASQAKLRIMLRDVSSFDTVLTDTEAGRCQIGASTVIVTDSRRSRFLFSTPYFPNRVVVVQKKSSGFTQPTDLKNHRVAVVKGTLSVGFVSTIPGVKPVIVEDDTAAFESLLKGESDALACDSAVVLHFLTLHPDLGMAFPIGDRSFFAFIFPKDSKLQPAMDAYLKKFIRSPEFTKILAKHFGESNAEFLASEVVDAVSR